MLDFDEHDETQEDTDNAETEAETEAEVEAEGEGEAEAPAEEAQAAPEPEPEPEEEPELVEEYSAKAQDLIEVAEGVDDPSAAADAWKKAVQAAPKAVKPRIRLGKAYLQIEEWKKSADALADALRKLPKGEYPSIRVGILEDLLYLYREQLGLAPKTLDALKQLTTLRPKNVQYIDLLIEQVTEMKRLPDLVAALKKKVEAVDTLEDKIEIQLEIARTYVEKFSNQAEAIKAYEGVLELDPVNTEAIGNLRGMYEKRRDWEKMIAVAKREVDLADDPHEKAERLIEVARLASAKIKKPAISSELWKQVLEFDENNVEALGFLEKIYEREKNWEELSKVAEKQLELLEDDGARGKLAQKLGVLYSDKMNEPEKAIAAWKQLLAIDPNNRRAQDSLKKTYLAAKAWEELEQFYGEQDKWDELIRVLERQVDSEDDDTKKLLLFKVANLWQQQIGKPDRAVRAYEAVLGVDANNLEAAEALIPLFQEASNPKKLVGVLEIQLRHTEDQAEKIERVRTLATIYEEQIRNKQQALSIYLSAFEEAWEETWIREEIERLGEETGEWQQIVGVYQAGYEKFTDLLEALPLMLVVARVYEEKLGDVEQALETNKRILELDDMNEQAIQGLERLYSATQDWPALLEVFQKKIDLAQGDDERREIYFQMARAYQTQIGDAAKAIEAYNNVLNIAGEDLEALQALDALYHSQEMWQELADIIGRELAIMPGDEVAPVADLKFRMGAIAEGHLNDSRTAIDNYRDILELDQAHEGAREALERYLQNEDFKLEVSKQLQPIYETLADFDKLVEVFEIQLAGEEDSFTKVELLLQIGDLHANKLMALDKAFDAYARCFAWIRRMRMLDASCSVWRTSRIAGLSSPLSPRRSSRAISTRRCSDSSTSIWPRSTTHASAGGRRPSSSSAKRSRSRKTISTPSRRSRSSTRVGSSGAICSRSIAARSI